MKKILTILLSMALLSGSALLPHEVEAVSVFGPVPNISGGIRFVGVRERSGRWSLRKFGRLGNGNPPASNFLRRPFNYRSRTFGPVPRIFY